MRNWKKDELTAFNESVKLTANGINALAVGAFGIAVIRPMAENGGKLEPQYLVWALIGLAMHFFARYIVFEIRKEAEDGNASRTDGV